MTFVRFLSTVNSAVIHKVTWQCKSFATNSTFKRFHSWMTSSVFCQLTSTGTASATICALVFSSMNIHMTIHVALRWITFITLSTFKWSFSSVHSFMNIQISPPCKTFVTNIAPIRPWLRFTNTISSSLVIPCTFTTNTQVADVSRTVISSNKLTTRRKSTNKETE